MRLVDVGIQNRKDAVLQLVLVITGPTQHNSVGVFPVVRKFCAAVPARLETDPVLPLGALTVLELITRNPPEHLRHCFPAFAPPDQLVERNNAFLLLKVSCAHSAAMVLR
jgi:hypothetical protein